MKNRHGYGMTPSEVALLIVGIISLILGILMGIRTVENINRPKPTFTPIHFKAAHISNPVKLYPKPPQLITAKGCNHDPKTSVVAYDAYGDEQIVCAKCCHQLSQIAQLDPQWIGRIRELKATKRKS